MRLCYVVLSPTFGMYQVAADLTNRFCADHEVHLLAARSVPRDRFAPAVQIHPLTNSGNSGLELASLDLVTLSRVLRTAADVAPDLVHFAAPHVWNLPLILWLRARRVPIVYTLHDLDPHHGTRFSGLMRLFNTMIVRLVDRVFVYGDVYKKRLVAEGLDESKITVIPLLMLFLSYEREQQLLQRPTSISYQPFVLFFGRLEPYKGVDVLLEAFRRLDKSAIRLVIAGPGDVSRYLPMDGLPSNVEVRSRHIPDEKAIELFRTCGLLVLPYLDATQSALIPAAYFFHKPVIVARSGALPEYVRHGQTGYAVEPRNAEQLAERILDAFSDPNRLQAMGEAGHRRYQRQRRLEYQTLKNVYASTVSHS
jgi:glycosyltransferase involved in cell wall biosynthesis